MPHRFQDRSIETLQKAGDFSYNLFGLLWYRGNSDRGFIHRVDLHDRTILPLLRSWADSSGFGHLWFFRSTLWTSWLTSFSRRTITSGVSFSRTVETSAIFGVQNGVHKPASFCILASLLSQPVDARHLMDHISGVNRQLGLLPPPSGGRTCCVFWFSLRSSLWWTSRWIRSTHRLHPHCIVGLSRWTLCCVPRLTESHFTSFRLKKFRKRSDLLHSRPEIYAQMLSHRRQPVGSLSSPQPGQGITHFCDHSGQNQRIGQNQLKFFGTNHPPSPFPDGVDHLCSIIRWTFPVHQHLQQGSSFHLSSRLEDGVQLEHDLTCRQLSVRHNVFVDVLRDGLKQHAHHSVLCAGPPTGHVRYHRRHPKPHKWIRLQPVMVCLFHSSHNYAPPLRRGVAHIPDHLLDNCQPVSKVQRCCVSVQLWQFDRS